MYNKVISNIKPLGFAWETSDPFLFCVHHLDHYPNGNELMGPAASLEGRNIGQDFTVRNGWRMYHGETIPGFPMHPHRGFETVTVVLNGFVDHSDSWGAGGRYGNGDVQWMTAGAGLQHSEMFPLIHSEQPNPLELFQIWLNLPRAKKFASPFYNMLWAEHIPVKEFKDKHGNKTSVRIIAGNLENTAALAPAPDSWAADPENEVAIWIITMEAGAEWTLPAASIDVNRALYFYNGSDIHVAGVKIEPRFSVNLLADQPVIMEAGEQNASVLLLQGKPINEPVVQHGPFVMNTFEEIQQAFFDYRKNQFGGWPWKRTDNVFPRSEGRFAKYADGKEEFPG
jgi:redox-sensitive bicupin YhaK (pirin superfamily)